MNITKPEFDGIIQTLPVGYYAKRRLKVRSDEKAETSYFSPLTDELVVSFPQIVGAMEKVNDAADREETIRSIFYHEVSHAILTPLNLKINDAVNIFEDERIETLLQDFYMNVDFGKNLYHMNGFEVGENPPEPTTALQAFYSLVRFRIGKPELLEEVDSLIQEYSDLDRNADYYTKDYYYDILSLYDRVAKDFESNPPEKKKEEEGNGNPSNSQKDENNNFGSNVSKEQTATKKDGCAHGEKKNPRTTKEIQELFSNSVNQTYNKKMFETFNMILQNFTKKNGGGSSIRAYSGVINPRSIVHKDYKIFDKSMSIKGGNQFGSLHLNLYIDCSGSFCSSQQIVNEMIYALTAIEKTNPNFSLDIVFCGMGETLVTSVADRILVCDGGNFLDSDIIDIYKKLQKKNTYNYNIVLFDGDAYSDYRSPNTGETNTHTNHFSVFDSNNCTIISDKDNRQYIEKTVTKARVIYTRKYADELFKNIKQTLENAFR